jgi:hypothetical protein
MVLVATLYMPPMPYNDVGACPFECYHYGAWTAQKLVIARQTYDCHLCRPRPFRGQNVGLRDSASIKTRGGNGVTAVGPGRVREAAR